MNKQKFLDESGVVHLYNKLSLQDYPNNETLIGVITAIDETKADKSELFSGSWNDLSDRPFGEVAKEETLVTFIGSPNSIWNSDYSSQEFSFPAIKYVPFTLGTLIHINVINASDSNFSEKKFSYDFSTTVNSQGKITVTGTEISNGFFNILSDDALQQYIIRTNGMDPSIGAYWNLTITTEIMEIKTLDSKFIGPDIARVSDIPNLSTYEFITIADIDAICGASIIAANEVTY